jgi:fluoroacetyl-CoA thioesterase
MDSSTLFRSGMAREQVFTVEEKYTAYHVGSGSFKVLATPWMIGLMELTSHELLAEALPDGYSSVGILVNIRHLAPTPVGSKVRVQAEIELVNGNSILFKVQAWDNHELIGSGHHERMIIEVDRFLRRVASKISD